jgi:hypothetical protein
VQAQCLFPDQRQRDRSATPHKKGEVVTQGSVNEAMWGTLRRVLKGQTFNYRELASFASTNSQEVSEETARATSLC